MEDKVIYLEKLRRLKELRELKVQKEESSKMSQGEAFTEGLTNGATLGFSDRIGGAINQGLKASGNLFVPEGGQNPYKDQSYSETYNQGVQDSRDRYKKAIQDHFFTTMGGNLVGAAPAAVATGGTLAGGAAMGAVSGLGASNDLTNLSDTSMSVAAGTALGLIPGTASKMTKTVGSVPKTILNRIMGNRDAKIAAKLESAAIQPKPPISGDEIFKVRKFKTDIGNTNGQGSVIPDRKKAVDQFLNNKSDNIDWDFPVQKR